MIVFLHDRPWAHGSLGCALSIYTNLGVKTSKRRGMARKSVRNLHAGKRAVQEVGSCWTEGGRRKRHAT